jgi:flagellar basal body-associated protein FliL
MPASQSQTQNSKGSAWWILLVVGVMVLMVPGGVFISPVLFLMAIIMRRHKPKEKSETPHSLLPLINTQP